MRIGHFIRSSLSEWKGMNSCVMVVRGSIDRCPSYGPEDCFELEGPSIEESEITGYIENNLDVLQAIAISGGEPFLQHDFYKFLKMLRRYSLPIMVHTEGHYPAELDDLAGARMFDRVSLFIPSPDTLNEEKVAESLGILARSDIPYEVQIITTPGTWSAKTIGSLSRKMSKTGTLVMCQDEKVPCKKKEATELLSAAKKSAKKVELKSFRI